MPGLETTWEVLLWLLIAMGVTLAVVIWVAVIVASVMTIFKFVKHYREASQALEEAEKPKEEDPQYEF